MSRKVELVAYGSEKTYNKIVECIPITKRNISTMDEFQEYISSLSKFVFIVLLLFYPSEQILCPIFAETKKKEKQVIAIFICGDPIDSLTNDSIPTCFLSKLLITYKINSTVPRFLETEYTRQIELGNINFAEALEQEREEIVKRLPTHDKLKACHILLIPLNTSRKHLHNTRQRLKNILYDLYGDEYKFIIRTLFDYIPEDEPDPDDRSYTAYLEKRYKGDICHTLLKLSFIRMYLVGNEPYIINRWSQKLVAAELDINQNDSLKYAEGCTFIINQPVLNQFRQDLVPIFGFAWQIRNAIAETLDDISNDIHFQNNLPLIHGCLSNREMAVNIELHQRSLANFEDITIFSSKAHIIQQAQNGPEEQQDTGDVNRQILL